MIKKHKKFKIYRFTIPFGELLPFSIMLKILRFLNGNIGKKLSLMFFCFVFYPSLTIYAENVILKNGSVIKGDIVELSDDGIKVQFSKAGSLATFTWDELDENFAKKIYFNFFKKRFNTENHILGVEIKEYKQDKVIKGINIKELSGRNFIYVKTKGKLIKLSRNTIEYIKPVPLSIFEIYSEKELYMQILRKHLTKRRRLIHKTLSSRLRKYNMKIYKLHLMLYFISQFDDLKSYIIYKPFNKLFEKAIYNKDICVFNYLVSRNWNTITFKMLYDDFIYVTNKCGYKNSVRVSERFEEKEFIVYSLLYNNLLNLYLLSFFNRPIKNLDSLVNREFDTKVKELSLIFGRDKKHIYRLWKGRSFNMFKVNGCRIRRNSSRFFQHWERINYNLKYLLLVNSFINRYLKLIGNSITKQRSNIECYQYVTK